MSPDTVSLLFPDRPIRPLPKRRLRERLSPEVAGSIKYPPSTHDNIPLFYYPPYTARNEGGPPSVESMSPVEQGRRNEPLMNASLRRNGFGLIGGIEDEAVLRSTPVTRSPPQILGRVAARPSPRLDHSRTVDPQPPPSATSSVDGYDSFENTNNKKKRKIPTAGDSALNSTHILNNEISSLAISTRAESPVSEFNGDRSQPNSSGLSGNGPYNVNNQGLSGSGRGRLSRSRNARSPLRTLPDGNSAWAGRTKASQSQLSTTGQRNSSIISNAIANAEKLPHQGQENVSLLQQHSATNKAMPASTQFTFTCESQVPGAVQWPGNPIRHGMISASSLPSATSANVNANQDSSAKDASGRSGNSRRKTRRRLEKELLVAARHRRQIAADSYYHNPPKLEDVWICEFCEYERIFGEPPRTLIRDYEIKDRRYRQEEADRKRLLEKAKAKSRKAKRNGKASTKGNHLATTSSEQMQAEQLGDVGAPPMDTGHSHSTQSEDEYEDDFDDDYSNPLPGRINDTGTTHKNIPPSRAKT
ncbi:hypothetical protein PT974_09256 [Cladobotryum mycophilum]|uniref:Uncharacterized protein n=1 Tax=Cladobotryum mycophilum TaxID=491253 RepID=A0ABR0SH15_9HYPO